MRTDRPLEGLMRKTDRGPLIENRKGERNDSKCRAQTVRKLCPKECIDSNERAYYQAVVLLINRKQPVGNKPLSTGGRSHKS